ncbi:glycosyltransferase family 2 protein [Methyloceanibacter caenitepidi]|uniref:Glycosyltransferase n=1 Tax=Methyloceanibacter caenitepidi TaxID=1384459 RepID=A0A0A8JZ82_9HYPH|nr:glycosyltransferase family 2 protein [Methyloceanibacter caenitepidi]BAQ15731.1 glycosyltransferase [Methyloceanibacter caenitepidi]
MSVTGRVSAIIPAYNRSHCIGRALESVLAQTLPPEEIIVVDDASTDDLAAVLAPFGDKVRCVRHETNQGAAAARNTGLEAAGGDWVAFLDSDDVWLEDKQAQQLAFMARLGLVGSCTGFKTISGTEAEDAWRPYAEILSESDTAWGCYTSPGSTLVVRRDAIAASGSYDAQFARFEDWDLMLRLVLDHPGRIGFLDTPLAAIHLGSSASRPAWNTALDLMLSKHGAALRARDPKLYRQFRSGIAFNRGAVFAGQGRWLGVGGELLRAFCLAPAGNWPFRVILGPRIRSLLRTP